MGEETQTRHSGRPNLPSPVVSALGGVWSKKKILISEHSLGKQVGQGKSQLYLKIKDIETIAFSAD